MCVRVSYQQQQNSHQGDLAPVDVELSSELLVAADGRLHLLAAAQLVVGALHLPQARREGHVGAHHHIDPAEGEEEEADSVLVVPGALPPRTPIKQKHWGKNVGRGKGSDS